MSSPLALRPDPGHRRHLGPHHRAHLPPAGAAAARGLPLPALFVPQVRAAGQRRGRAGLLAGAAARLRQPARRARGAGVRARRHDAAARSAGPRDRAVPTARVGLGAGLGVRPGHRAGRGRAEPGGRAVRGVLTPTGWALTDKRHAPAATGPDRCTPWRAPLRARPPQESAYLCELTLYLDCCMFQNDLISGLRCCIRLFPFHIIRSSWIRHCIAHIQFHWVGWTILLSR